VVKKSVDVVKKSVDGFQGSAKYPSNARNQPFPRAKNRPL
jgi:hypothetical protein